MIGKIYREINKKVRIRNYEKSKQNTHDIKIKQNLIFQQNQVSYAQTFSSL